MTLVRPGRLDVRVLGQSLFWVNRQGVVLVLAEMSVAHLAAVAGMLRGQATVLHFWALVGALHAVSDAAGSGVPVGDELEFALTGASIADATAGDFVEASTLLRAIDRILAGSG